MFVTCLAALISVCAVTVAQENEEEWVQPEVVSALPGDIPSDAIVLFDGHGFDEWQKQGGGDVHWLLDKGEIVVQRGGGIVTKREFGDMQIHVEYKTPAPPRGSGQSRGNSGVYVHGMYEVQVLDSYDNDTYPDGMASAIYQQHVPLVNPSRPPGLWQAYDIIFHAARFDNSGNVTENPRMTILFNGVLVQDNVTLEGPTAGGLSDVQRPTGPIFLQDHQNPIRYRNIWVRELNPR